MTCVTVASQGKAPCFWSKRSALEGLEAAALNSSQTRRRHPGLIRSRHPGDRAGKPRALDMRPSRRSGCCWRSMRSMQRLSFVVDDRIPAIWCAIIFSSDLRAQRRPSRASSCCWRLSPRHKGGRQGCTPCRSRCSRRVRRNRSAAALRSLARCRRRNRVHIHAAAAAASRVAIAILTARSAGSGQGRTRHRILAQRGHSS